MIEVFKTCCKAIESITAEKTASCGVKREGALTEAAADAPLPAAVAAAAALAEPDELAAEAAAAATYSILTS